MAATFAFRATGEGFNPSKVPGAYFDALIEVSGDASYPAGGYAFGLAQLQTLTGGAGSMIESVEVANPWINTASNGTAFVAGWDKTNNKLHAFAQAVAGGGTALVDVTAATSLTGFVATLRVRWH